MKAKTLIETNPFLKDPKIRKQLIERSVISSSGVEGIKVDTDNLYKSHKLIASDKRKIYTLTTSFEIHYSTINS